MVVSSRLVSSRLVSERSARAGPALASCDSLHARDAFEQSTAFVRQINARPDRQIARIVAGSKRSGERTRHEFRALMGEQRHVQAMEQRFLADGIILKTAVDHL